jgi:rhodanese-related sulfurtransferase
MKEFAQIFIRAVVIAVVFASVGVGLNAVSSAPMPWMYSRPEQLEISGIKIPLIDETSAHEMFETGTAVFVDTRTPDDYGDSHVKGALSLPPTDMEEKFPDLEPLLPQTGKLVLYCYGPECDMAEQVAGFLVKLGYADLAIMNAGFHAWEDAGFPVESRNKAQKARAEGRYSR